MFENCIDSIYKCTQQIGKRLSIDKHSVFWYKVSLFYPMISDSNTIDLEAAVQGCS